MYTFKLQSEGNYDYMLDDILLGHIAYGLFYPVESLRLSEIRFLTKFMESIS